MKRLLNTSSEKFETDSFLNLILSELHFFSAFTKVSPAPHLLPTKSIFAKPCCFSCWLIYHQLMLYYLWTQYHILVVQCPGQGVISGQWKGGHHKPSENPTSLGIHPVSAVDPKKPARRCPRKLLSSDTTQGRKLKIRLQTHPISCKGTFCCAKRTPKICLKMVLSLLRCILGFFKCDCRKRWHICTWRQAVSCPGNYQCEWQ